MKTAMQQLKDKIQVIIGEMNGELNLYESCYKQCLINIQNDIDLQMLAMEKLQIVDAYEQGVEDEYQYHINGYLRIEPSIYYNETYGE